MDVIVIVSSPDSSEGRSHEQHQLCEQITVSVLACLNSRAFGPRIALTSLGTI